LDQEESGNPESGYKVIIHGAFEKLQLNFDREKSSFAKRGWRM
jgi:hypothetical protein